MSQWVRLWDDMPTDPKWRLIARRSGRSISEVMAVFNFMMINAGHWNHRGELSGWDNDVVGSALDIDSDDVAHIMETMQGLILDGNCLKGWNNRQTKRVDESTERVRSFRVTQRNAAKRGVTQRNALEHIGTRRNEFETAVTPEEEEEEEVEEDKKDISSRCSDIGAHARTKPKAKRKSSKTEISETAEPNHLDLEFARTAGMDSRRIEGEWDQFRDHHRKLGNRMADWCAAWRTWVRNAKKFSARDGPKSGKSNGMGELSEWVLEGMKNVDEGRCEEGAAKIIPLLPVDGKRNREEN